MEIKFEIARRMREIKSDDRSRRVPGFRYLAHLKSLSGVVVHAAKHHES